MGIAADEFCPSAPSFIGKSKARFWAADEARHGKHNPKGGLGAVFVALDTELHREVALKQIHDRLADDPTSRRRFLIEAEISGGLEHPGIVSGLEGMKSREAMIPPTCRGQRLSEAIDRAVRLYDLWGKPARAALWRQKFGIGQLPADVFAASEPPGPKRDSHPQ
jgi:hypothetical protein